MKLCISLSLVALVSTATQAHAQTVRYTTLGFEAPTFVPGILADDRLNQFGGQGQDDWIATPDGSSTIDFSKITVQTSTVFAGSQAITIDATGQNVDFLHLRRNLAFDPMDDPTRPVLDIHLRVRITSSATASEAWAFQAQATPQAGIFTWDVHPDGHLHYTDPATNTEVDSGFVFARDQWHAVTTSIDYATHLVTVYVDGTSVASFVTNQGASFPLFSFASLVLFGPGDDQMHVDGFEIVSRPQGPLQTSVGTNYCGPAASNSTGQPGHLAAYGSATAADNSLRLEATSLPPHMAAMFLAATQNGFLAGPGGSQGNLCIGGTIGRYNLPGQFALTGAGGVGTLTLDLTQTPTFGSPVPIVAGQTWYFQCWYRDLNPGQTTNFTEGLMVAFQ